MRAQAPDDARTHLLASQIAWRDNRVRVATEEALAAFAVVPDDPALLCDTIDQLLQTGEVVAARGGLARPAMQQATAPSTLLRMVEFRQRLNENVEALALLERVAAAGADDPETAFRRGSQLYFHGRMAAAETALEACLAQAPQHGPAAFTLSSLRAQTPASNHLARLEIGLAQVANGSLAHAGLEFARYKEFDDLGRFEEAWQALVAGNAVMRARNRFDAQTQVAFLERLLATCTAERLQGSPADDAGPQPIFILGFPRSGTTLLDRMLGSHPQVRSAGETSDFGAQLQWSIDARFNHSAGHIERFAALDFAELGRRYLARARWRACGKPRFIDKQPPNWEIAGLIHAALPGAKILHLTRDPVDVCFSNWRAFLGDGYGYSYDLRTLGVWYRAYRRTMQQWHRLLPGAILDVPYAELAGDPAATLRKVLDFCGLAWDPACASADANPSPAMTLSAAQIRGPVRVRTAMWQPYAQQLAPMLAALAQTT